MKSALLILLLVIKVECRKITVKSPLIQFSPCLGWILKSVYEYKPYPVGEENQYTVGIERDYTAGTTVIMEFDSKAVVELTKETERNAELLPSPLPNTFVINYITDSNFINFIVKGFNGVVPYFNSILINGVNHCHTPMVGYLDNIIKNNGLAIQVKASQPIGDCGRRKVDYIELIVSGQSSRPGDWPWHAAIYRYESASNSYQCGGTLISKHFVITVAHCATINEAPLVPDIFRVVLGKYHLIENDNSVQVREVISVIIHEDFGSPLPMDNDIALLKLKTEVVYNDYIQPACLWSNDAYKLSVNQIIGTVVGWGTTQRYDHALSSELRQASLPIITNEECIKSNPYFYGTKLRNNRKFCAGWGNGTSPCNGDSGSGFMVHVPDTLNDFFSNKGTWYVRGITSMTIRYRLIAVCDPSQHVLFTDIAKYEDWIRIKIYDNISCRRPGA